MTTRGFFFIYIFTTSYRMHINGEFNLVRCFFFVVGLGVGGKKKTVYNALSIYKFHSEIFFALLFNGPAKHSHKQTHRFWLIQLFPLFRKTYQEFNGGVFFLLTNLIFSLIKNSFNFFFFFVEKNKKKTLGKFHKRAQISFKLVFFVFLNN